MSVRDQLASSATEQGAKTGLGIIVSLATVVAGFTLQEWVLIVTLLSVGLGGLHTAYKLWRDIVRDRREARREAALPAEPWV